ncbi:MULTISPECIES: FAD-dependent oxidoreductase [Streptosporangium]|uniref:FAD-dependent urate hydroxylase n=1 Tax=Streptosporangium brasiliense TaxID=47480 RepID=A0ABT9RKN2_9ACTN|nr:FAD-dependent monooxygenase [Streptosporangium brasiliense]MDP9869859.1 FAD-dependent urate hydroxylase [Streptosporangium brasiliense]
MDVLVIGAGVGGLAVARSLLAAGHQVRIYEQAPTMRTGGAGLSIFSNGAAVLHDLGVSLDGVGGRFDRIDALTADGRLRLSSDMAHAATLYGFPNKSISRRLLLERLSEGLPGDLISYGTGCRKVTQDGDRVTATFDDGSMITGDLLIGADGHHSVVRRELWGDLPIRTATFGTWQALSRIDIDLTRAHLHLMITGREGACGIIPAGDGKLQWWFDVRWSPGEPRPVAPLAELRRRFGHWASPVPELLAQASEDDLDFFGHHWQKVRREWGKGRVTLLGDAAHLMPPTLGQGANQTLEDVWVLGRELAKGGDPAQRLRAYERARYPHVNLVSRLARHSPANWRIPPLIGRMFSETSQSGMLARFSNRLTALPH